MNKLSPTTGIFNFSRVIYIWGSPLEYSISPFFQEHALLLSGCRTLYKIFRGGEKEFSGLLRADNCIGANITAPFKVDALEICDKLTQQAVASGCVNTIYKIDGELWGDITDGTGMVKWLVFKDKPVDRVNILGNGGSAMALCASLSELGCRISIFGRKEKGWENTFGSFYDFSLWKNDATTINTMPFNVFEPGVINIGYSFGNISEDAAGMLSFQGLESARRWLGKKMIDEKKYSDIVFMHHKAQLNSTLILKLAGII